MNVKLRVLSAGALFFIGSMAYAQKKPADTAKVTDIEEVVMVGFGQKRAVKEITGSVGTVKAEKINDLPLASPEAALMGRVAGVQGGVSSGQPGGFVTLRIRGQASINGNNNPIYIIDGVRVMSGDPTANNTTGNILSSLNPDDIESMTVLKDAVSTAIYGADAGAGVVIITTKSGKAGKPRFSFSSTYGLNKTAVKQPSVLNRDQYTQYASQSYANAANVSLEDAYDTLVGAIWSPFENNNTDWRSIVQRGSAVQKDINFSASGGNDRFKYYSSFGTFDQESIYRNSDFKRFSASTKLEYKATDRLTINTDVQLANTTTRTLPNGGAYANPVLSQFFTSPLEPAYNDDGSIYLGSYDDGTYGGLPISGVFNPAAVLAYNSNKANTTRLFGNIGIGYNILKGLNYKFNFAPEYVITEENEILSPIYGDGLSTNGRMTSGTMRYFNYNVSNFLGYNFSFADVHRFNASIFQEAYQTNTRSLSATGQSVALSTLNNLSSFVVPIEATGINNQLSARSGYGATLGYNYDNFLNVDLSARRDAVSYLQPGNKAGNFWSAGIGVDLAKALINENDYLNSLRLRASYGKVGNRVSVSPYSIYSYTINYNDLAGAGYGGFNNPNLQWETVNPFNLGVDLSLFKNKLTITAEYFNKKTKNLIYSIPLSTSQGLASYFDNVGDLVNKGFEFTANANIINPVAKGGFALSMDGNISLLKNEVTQLYEGKDVISGTTILRQGETVNSWFMRKWAGVDPTNGNPLWYINGVDGETTSNYSQAQRAIQGSRIADVYGGVGLNMSYKNFSVSAQGQFSFGAKMYDDWAFYMQSDGTYSHVYNSYADALDYWTPTNTGAANPKPFYNTGARGTGSTSANNASTRFLRKADFLRLSNLKVAYSFDKDFLGDIPVNKVTVYVMANNLYTHRYDKQLKYDPDMAIIGTSNLNLPVLKTYLVGFNIDF
ncbi:SusC/RagA family TonB-linked outer membrane protein [Chryseobacterium sp. LC2016-29]|uniref:SusC/RagA family TonB-linked outer membrane protein n=1 Tax=Chryseobacterium sp. LC2016-29 TaxID=2897331 RepID=UPI001E3831A0|nr:SusC/RagA family TonB-linked outer membrane protein [Chryseobacterium sp. LC2016-29]MCD0478484.1 SusC/RagA family TonB-linked outer membrane protein [Chryseobacterium sp. LC2016-29]